jgi:predicted ATPase
LTDTAERAVTPRWPDAFPAALPTPMIGRDRELHAILELIDSGARLVTLVGPGGVGKTRLARHVARDRVEAFEGRVAWVDLDPLDDPSLLLPEMAAFMGIGEGQGSDVLERVGAALGDGRSLVVFDPVDRVASGVALLPELLRRTPGLTILATGRAPIGVREETVVTVEPLAVTEPRAAAEAIATTPAVALFIDRLARVRPDIEPAGQTLTVIADIVRALDGLPLAIELAAAACRVIDPHQLLYRLSESITALGAADPVSSNRHNSLRAMMDRTVELLPDPVSRMLRRISVIAAPFHRDTAEAVLEGGERRGLAPLGIPVVDALKALVDASLLRRVGRRDRPRYSMLHTIRADALARLEQSGELVAMRWAHAYHFVAIAEAAEADLPTEREPEALDHLERVHDDLRAALDWAIDRDDGAFAARLAGALAEFWRVRGHHTEGRIRLQAALAAGSGKPAPRQKALVGAGVLASYQGDYTQADNLLFEALAIARAASDDEATASTLTWLGMNGQSAGHLDDSQEYIAEGLALRRRLADSGRIAVSLDAMGGILHVRGDFDGAREVFEESLGLKRERANESEIAMALTNLGRVERDAGNTDRAAGLFADAVLIWQRTGDRQQLPVGRHNAALVALDRGDLKAARRGLQSALATAREFDDRPEMAAVLTDLARVECAAGRWERAHDALVEALRLTALVKIGVVVSLALESTAIWLAGTGRPLEAARMIGAADADRGRIGFVRMPADERLLAAATAPAKAVDTGAWGEAAARGEELVLEAAIAAATALLATTDAATTDGAASAAPISSPRRSAIGDRR